MINLTSVSAAVEAVKADFQEACSRSAAFLFNGVSPCYKKTNQEYLSESEALMDLLKAKMQGENLIAKLYEFKNAVECIKSGDFVNVTRGYDIDIDDNWDPYGFLGALLYQSVCDQGLPQEYEDYDEFSETINRLKVDECLSKYTDFIDHARAMVLLKRPFDELLAIITP